MSFTTEAITGCTNEATNGANKVSRNPPPVFISSFTVSVALSINTLESSNNL